VRSPSWREVLLFAGALVAALGACEIATRLLGIAPIVHRVGVGEPQSAFRLSPNPILGWELRPGYRDASADCSMSFPYVNADGLRDREHTVEKPTGRLRIAVIGDSVVLGLNLCALDELIAPSLERALGRSDVEVIGAGITGYNTRAEAELLRTKVVKYAPDLVVVVFVDNDVQSLNDYVPGVMIERPALLEWLVVRSALVRTVAVGLRWYTFGAEADRTFLAERQQRAVEEQGRMDSSVDDGLAELVALSRTHDFGVFVVVWPRFRHDDIGDGPVDPEAPDRLIIESLTQRYGLPSGRLSPAFRCDLAMRPPPRDPAALYAPDGLHPTDLGVEIGVGGMVALLDAAGAWRPPPLRNLTTPPPLGCPPGQMGASGRQASTTRAAL
jgi:lysophospholipase L1-like esterase